jgi:haloalkane dehalogenase
MMVQDWGGPIGFAAATRNPDRFAAFVIANTWAWPKSDFGTQVFSRFLGGPVGKFLILRRNFFVERIIPAGVRRQKPSKEVMGAYRGPFPTPERRSSLRFGSGMRCGKRPDLFCRPWPDIHQRAGTACWRVRQLRGISAKHPT